jgi:hypothetical protein
MAFLAYCARFTNPPKRLPVGQARIILMLGYIMAIDSTEQRPTLILFYIGRALRCAHDTRFQRKKLWGSKCGLLLTEGEYHFWKKKCGEYVCDLSTLSVDETDSA